MERFVDVNKLRYNTQETLSIIISFILGCPCEMGRYFISKGQDFWNYFLNIVKRFVTIIILLICDCSNCSDIITG